MHSRTKEGEKLKSFLPSAMRWLWPSGDSYSAEKQILIRVFVVERKYVELRYNFLI